MVEDTLDVLIRAADVSDAERIARVHVSSWREAYADLVPGEHLPGHDAQARARDWAEHLTNPPRGSSTWVATEGETVLGFAALGPSRDEDADRTTLEIYAIYLEPSAWGRGVARDLMRTVLAAVPAEGVVTLWAPDGNERARHFYRRNGFQPDGVERIEEIGGLPLKEIRYRRG